MSTLYTVGFAFSKDHKTVALIEKQRPKWQAGKLNGIGGHVENGERYAAAQQREFWEETGVTISDWKAYATLVGPDWQCRCFVAFTDDIFNVQSMTDERVVRVPVDKVGLVPMIDNLAYLIPLALDTEQVGVPMFHYGRRPMPVSAGSLVTETFDEISLEEILDAAKNPIATTIAA